MIHPPSRSIRNPPPSASVTFEEPVLAVVGYRSPAHLLAVLIWEAWPLAASAFALASVSQVHWAARLIPPFRWPTGQPGFRAGVVPSATRPSRYGVLFIFLARPATRSIRLPGSTSSPAPPAAWFIRLPAPRGGFNREWWEIHLCRPTQPAVWWIWLPVSRGVLVAPVRPRPAGCAI